MSVAVPADVLAMRLERALAQNELPIAAQRLGFRLLNRLNAPVRVALFSTDAGRNVPLANGLAGRAVIPEDRRLPLVELAYGPKERTSFIAAQDVVSTADGICLDGRIAPPIDLIRIDLPQPVLRNMSLLVVTFDDMGAPEFDRAQDRADIGLWCTEEFGPQEQSLWAAARDGLRDNSYLTLTNADALFLSGRLDHRIAALRQFTQTDFFSFFATSANVARACGAAEGTPDPMWEASGLAHVQKTLFKRIRSGQTADANSTLLFLANNGLQLDDQPPAPQPAPVESPSADALSVALTTLHAGAADLRLALCHIGPRACSEILEHCQGVMNDVSEMLAEEPAVQEAFWEASDMLTLMQIEGDEAAAADAVTLLLQLSREMQERLAG